MAPAKHAAARLSPVVSCSSPSLADVFYPVYTQGDVATGDTYPVIVGADAIRAVHTGIAC